MAEKLVERAEDEKEGTTTEERAEEVEFADFIRGVVTENRASNLTFGDNGAVIPKTIAQKIIKKVYDICPILEKSTKYNVKGTLSIPYYPLEDENDIAVGYHEEFTELTSNAGKFGPILEKSTKYNVKGTLSIPYYPLEDENDIAVGYHEEFTELTSNAGKFGSIDLKGFLAGALTLVSKSLINNSQFDIVSFVIDHMAYSIARWVEGELLNGTDSKVDGLSKVKNVITAATSNAITADELIDLQSAIKDAFQQNAIWIMSSKTRTAIRKLKDQNGRYLLQDDATSAFGNMLLGKPVYVSDNMKDMTASTTAIYYGDMSGLAVKITEEMEVQVLREKYATQHAVGVVAWMEFDSKVENEQKIAVLKMGA